MRSAAHDAQRAVHSHQYGRHASPPKSELTLPVFWVAFTVSWVVPSTSDATASNNASKTRPAVVPENSPAFIELQHKALAARAVRLKSKLHEPCVECSTSGKRLKNAESVIVLAQPRHATELSNQKKSLTFHAWQAG